MAPLRLSAVVVSAESICWCLCCGASEAGPPTASNFRLHNSHGEVVTCRHYRYLLSRSFSRIRALRKMLPAVTLWSFLIQVQWICSGAFDCVEARARKAQPTFYLTHHNPLFCSKFILHFKFQGLWQYDFLHSAESARLELALSNSFEERLQMPEPHYMPCCPVCHVLLHHDKVSHHFICRQTRFQYLVPSSGYVSNHPLQPRPLNTQYHLSTCTLVTVQHFVILKHWNTDNLGPRIFSTEEQRQR